MKLLEEYNKTAVLGFGRLNPPTIGHLKLVDTIKDTASTIGGEPMLYLSHSQDSKKNPLSYEEKVKWCKKAFGDVVKESNARTIVDVIKEVYNNGYTNLVYVGGEDCIGGEEDITNVLLKYNGQPNKSGEVLYNFDSIDFINAGNRNSSSNDLSERASASLARKLAQEGNFEEFKQVVPFREDEAEELYNVLRKKLGVNEGLLKEGPTGVPAMSKSTYIKLKDKVDKELKKYGLEAPDANKGLDDYKTNPEDYQGLFVKQNSDKKLSFSAKDLFNMAQNDSSIPNDIVDILDNLVIVDQNGNKYGLHKSGAQVTSNKKDSFPGTIATYYQEAIYSLLLVDRIPEAHSSEFKQWLLESDPHNNTGIFEYIIPIEVNDAFASKWQGFIKDWFKAFNTIVNNRNEFVVKANEILAGDVDTAVVLHSGVKNEYTSVARKLLTGKDNYDKSDVYYCIGNVSDITSQMLSQPSVKDYVQFMLDNCKQIIGVSLKKPSGNGIVVHWDIPAVEDDYFDSDVVWNGSETGLTQVIKFNTDDGEVQFQIKSNKAGATGTLEWKAKNAKAQLGKAVTATKTVLSGEAKDSVIAPLSSKVRDFDLAAKNFMRLITGEQNPQMNVKYNMTERGLRLVTQIFNLSCGFAAVDVDDMKRITAPYLKVY